MNHRASEGRARAADPGAAPRGPHRHFHDELAALKAGSPEALSVTVALSDEGVPPSLAAAHPALEFDAGFVHAVAGRRMKGRFENVRAYAAGPPPMVEATLRMLLLEGRLTSDNIRYDKFS